MSFEGKKKLSLLMSKFYKDLLASYEREAQRYSEKIGEENMPQNLTVSFTWEIKSPKKRGGRGDLLIITRKRELRGTDLFREKTERDVYSLLDEIMVK